MLHADIDWLLTSEDGEVTLAADVAASHAAKVESIPLADRLQAAAAEYVALRDRKANPAGKFDRSGRFWPAPAETCSCCIGIRAPSKAWPYSLLLHCRTAGHVAARHGLDALAVRRAARLMIKATATSKAA
jgi:hypothetical protein